MADDKERNQGTQQGGKEGDGKQAPGRNPQDDRSAGGGQEGGNPPDEKQGGQGPGSKEGGQNEETRR